MTTALILAATVLLVVWAAVALVRAISSGGQPGSAPRHADKDWSADSLPSRPYRQVPRLP